ncbi:MAG: PAS domain-containing sensor histidine kinase [Alphaproteobacteria bacterium]|nr:PAS domain-containing sensor histidine kinase [Alphaproteobacteria bacterium]
MREFFQGRWIGSGDIPPNEMLAAGAIALVLIAVLTAGLAAASMVANVDHVTSIYLIPVLVAAIRGGVAPAVVAAAAGIGAAAFFFYAPVHDFRVQNTLHIVDLVLFVAVAAVIGRIATNLRRARMREAADRLREALIGSVSHELRTPLTAIVGSASVLAQAPQVERDPRLGPLVAGLREEAERLDAHIQNLLDATSISSEGVRPQIEWIDPADVINAAIERKRTLLEGRPLAVKLAGDPPLVRVDAGLIERALSQVIENAVKYSPAGSPIEIAVERDGDRVRIEVRDRGAGLTAAERERIWERFYRGPRHRDTVAGSGLGLWVAHGLVTACGGAIAAESEGPERGTCIAVHLPAPPYQGAARISETLSETSDETNG